MPEISERTRGSDLSMLEISVSTPGKINSIKYFLPKDLERDYDINMMMTERNGADSPKINYKTEKKKEIIKALP